jgi:hypothetical protein
VNVEQESWQMAHQKNQDESHKYDGHIILLFSPVCKKVKDKQHKLGAGRRAKRVPHPSPEPPPPHTHAVHVEEMTSKTLNQLVTTTKHLFLREKLYCLVKKSKFVVEILLFSQIFKLKKHLAKNREMKYDWFYCLKKIIFHRFLVLQSHANMIELDVKTGNPSKWCHFL